MKDSSWLLSWTINRQPQYRNQPKGQVLVWLYGMFSDRPGDFIKKPMRDCTGMEICEEWLYHLGVPVDQIEDLAKNSANTVPVMMPFASAYFQPREAGDRPDVVPTGSVNFAFIGNFAETPRDTVFTTEYSIRTAMEAVYTLLDIDRGVPEVWGSVYDIRDLLNNPSAGISAKGGKPTKKKEALTDEQAKRLLETTKGLPPYVFIMIGLYSGLRREEILALQWDCVFLDAPTPYISVRRAWRTEHNRPVISSVLKTEAAKRDIPIPKCLVECLREAKATSISDYVIADSKGQPLSYSQFHRVWQYVVVRSTKERTYYKYVNGESIKYTVTPTLGGHQKNNPKIVYSLDFEVTPHQLRHTYITNLLYAGVDPKTVQYLAGHENSKTTMDIYAKVKYNKPEELSGVVNAAFNH